MTVIETAFDHDPNQHSIIIFEREKKKETEDAEKRLEEQVKKQAEIEARIRKKLGLEDTSSKPETSSA